MPSQLLSYLTQRDPFPMRWTHKSHILLPSQQTPSGFCDIWDKSRRKCYCSFLGSLALPLSPFLMLSLSFCLSSTHCFIPALSAYDDEICQRLLAYRCLFLLQCNVLIGSIISITFHHFMAHLITQPRSCWQRLKEVQAKIDPTKFTRKCQWFFFKSYFSCLFLFCCPVSLFFLLTHVQGIIFCNCSFHDSFSSCWPISVSPMRQKIYA